MEQTKMQKTSRFTRFAKRIAHFSGRPAAFAIAAGFLVAWGVAGPIFGFSEKWQLIVNTVTSIVTFLMVFLIQNTQNRDTVAMQIKLDELIRVTHGHNALMDLEELEEDDLEGFRRQYEAMAARARQRIGKDADDTDGPQPP
jgi:low affinity Fe/Cu permease